MHSPSNTAQCSTHQEWRSNGTAVQPLRDTAPISKQLKTVIPQHPSQNKAVFSLSSMACWKGKKLRTHGVLLYVQAVRCTLWTDSAQTYPKVPPEHTLRPSFPTYRVGMDCSPSKSQQHGQSATSYSTCLHACYMHLLETTLDVPPSTSAVGSLPPRTPPCTFLEGSVESPSPSHTKRLCSPSWLLRACSQRI